MGEKTPTFGDSCGDQEPGSIKPSKTDDMNHETEGSSDDLAPMTLKIPPKPPTRLGPPSRCPFAHGRPNPRAAAGGYGQVAYAENSPAVYEDGAKRNQVLEWSEIQRHTSRESAWMVLNGKVYDITDYLSAHPGGSEILLKFCGRDATKQFMAIHPWVNIQNIIGHRQIGIVSSQPAASRSLRP